MRVLAVVLVLGAGVTAGCFLFENYRPPAPVPIGDRAAFNAYAASFTYDTAQLAVDKQLLSDSTLHNNGPLAEIQPTRDAYRADSRALANGVVLARIVVHQDRIPWNDSGYAHYALRGPGTVYWFVQRGRSYFVPQDARQAIDSSMTLDAGKPHEETWGRSAARWRWSATDEQPWVTCDKNRCCYAQ